MNTDELREALRRDAELAGRPPTDLVHRVAGLRRRSHRRRAAVAGGALAIVVAVVGVSVLDGARERDGGSDVAAVVDPEAAAAAYRESIANANADSAASYASSAGSLADYLPNRQYRNPFTGGLDTLADAVVVGHVTSVSPGRGFYDDGEVAPGDAEIDFEDPRATWRTIHAEVAVTEVLGGQLGEDTIVVGLVRGPDMPFEVAAEGLPALGELVLILDRGSAVYQYDPSLWAIAEDGAVMAEIGPEGRLTLPALDPYRAEQFLAVNPTLDSLRAAAQEPARVVPFETPQD